LGLKERCRLIALIEFVGFIGFVGFKNTSGKIGSGLRGVLWDELKLPGQGFSGKMH